MAAYAARAGMKALLFVPYKQISAAKLAQALDFGALVVEVGDNFDEAFRLLQEIAPELGLYLVNSINPFRIEGQKTIVAELLEQRAWRPPDYIVVPGGNLGNSSAIGKGLRELKDLGLIEKVPHIVIVQAAGANPFYQTLRAGAPDLLAVENPNTEATAIRIGHPANWKKAKRALDWAGGFCESVTDEEIFEAKRVLAEDGVGCEPASAATCASWCGRARSKGTPTSSASLPATNSKIPSTSCATARKTRKTASDCKSNLTWPRCAGN
jgi:threonine synthase